MSALLGALGGDIAGMLGRGAGWIAGKAMPYIQRAGSWLSGLFGGNKSTGLGKSSDEHYVDRTINSGIDGIKYANNSLLGNSMPMISRHIDNAAENLRSRLRMGYGAMMGGNGT